MEKGRLTYCLLSLLFLVYTPAIFSANIRDSIPADTLLEFWDNKIDVKTHQVGNAEHVYRLLQGEIAGMHVTKPTANIFEPYIIRSRGINTFSYANSSPQALLNGMPIFNVQMLNAWDVTGVDVDLSAAENVRHGLRGAQGSINLHTDHRADDDFFIRYGTVFSLEVVDRQTPILDAQAFVRNGGADLGRRNDFQKEITQVAPSWLHNLAIHKKVGTTQISASAQWRPADQVLKSSFNKELRALVSIHQSLWKDRISLNWQSNIYQGDHNFGEPRAFFYAQRFKPTSPIYDLSNDTYGGFFEEQLFDYYNPVSIVNQVNDVGKSEGSIHQLRGAVKLYPSLQLRGSFGHENFKLRRRGWIPATSFFGGWDNGNASRKTADLANTFIQGALTFNREWDDIQFTSTLGYDHQEVTHETDEVTGRGFLNDVNDHTLPGEGTWVSESAVGEAYRTINFFSSSNLKVHDHMNIGVHLARSGSSRLGISNQWAWMYGIGSDIRLDGLILPANENPWVFHLQWGRTGAAPPQDNLGNYVLEDGGTTLYNGQYQDFLTYRHIENPDLTWEKKKEWQVGLTHRLVKNRVQFGIMYFKNNAYDLIDRRSVQIPPNLARSQWTNLYAIKSRGWEFLLDYRIQERERFSWYMRLNVSRFKSKLTEFPPSLQNIGANCGCGGRPWSPQYILEDEFLGNLYAWQEAYDRDQGGYLEVDVNGDDGLDFEDQSVAGNAYPKWRFGMKHEFGFGKFGASFRFRGSMGHRLVHVDRLYYELSDLTSVYNVVSTRYFKKISSFQNVLSERFVENASYLMLDQMILSYNLGQITKGLQDLMVQIGGRQLLTLTRYTGQNPEVRYQDVEYEADGSLRAFQSLRQHAINSGYENRYVYPFARSIFFGLQVTF